MSSTPPNEDNHSTPQRVVVSPPVEQAPERVSTPVDVHALQPGDVDGDAATVGSPDSGVSVGSASLSEFDAMDDQTYMKVLSSEVQDTESVQLLKRVRELKPTLYGAFTDEELADIASKFSVLRFEPGDTVIESGADASFFGIVLSGTFSVDLFQLEVTLGEGAMLGEMNFWDGGRRTASISAKEEGLIAVVTYDELRQLRVTDPVLMTKLVEMLAQATIAVLKGIAQRVTKRVKVLEEEKAVASGGKAVDVDQTPDSQAIQQERRIEEPAAGGFAKRHKAELVYRSRMKAQERKTEEVLKQALKQQMAAEKRVRNHKYQILNRENKIKKLTEKVEKQREELTRLRDFEERAVVALQESHLDTTELRRQNKELGEHVEFYRTKYEEALAKADEQADELVAQHSQQMQQLEAKVAEREEALTEHHRNMERLEEEHKKNVSKLQEELGFTQQRRQSAVVRLQTVAGALEDMHKDESVLDQALMNPHVAPAARVVKQLQTEVRRLESQVEHLQFQAMKKNAQINSLQHQVEEANNTLAQHAEESSTLQQKLDQTHALRVQARMEHAKLEKVAQNARVQQYIRSWQLRRILRKSFSAIAVRLDEMIKAVSDESDAVPTFKHVKLSLAQVDKTAPRGSLRALCEALEGQMMLASQTFKHMLEMKDYWKQNCDSFFNATIRLRGDLQNAAEEAQTARQTIAKLERRVAAAEATQARETYGHVRVRAAEPAATDSQTKKRRGTKKLRRGAAKSFNFGGQAPPRPPELDRAASAMSNSSSTTSASSPNGSERTGDNGDKPLMQRRLRNLESLNAKLRPSPPSDTGSGRLSPRSPRSPRSPPRELTTEDIYMQPVSPRARRTQSMSRRPNSSSRRRRPKGQSKGKSSRATVSGSVLPPVSPPSASRPLSAASGHADALFDDVLNE